LQSLRQVNWPVDELLGTTHYSVGLIRGGVAPNVVPAEATAEIVFRSVGDHRQIRERLNQVAGTARIDEVIVVPPVRLHVPDGFETAVFAYTTDIPLLARWGTPLLLGPGSIHVAHTDDEHIAVGELLEGVNAYVALAKRLLTPRAP